MIPGRDPGLQPERTAMAWNRTALAMLGNALLVLRVGLQGQPALTAGALVLLGMAAALVLLGSRRGRWMSRPDPAATSALPFVLTSVLTAIAAGVGLWTLVHFDASP